MTWFPRVPAFRYVLLAVIAWTIMGAGPVFAQRDTALAAEKIHLHLDKPHYVSGQTIWLKAYVTDGLNRPSMLSKIAYVELVNEQRQIRASLKLPVAVGLAYGDILLPDTLSEGNYWIRAYTQWMRNFGEDSFFDRALRIDNTLSNEVLAAVNYRYQEVAGGVQTQAEISFTDIQGNALANTEVNYQVRSEKKTEHKGSGLTDAQGKLIFSFAAADLKEQKGTILTSLRYRDKAITKTFSYHVQTGDISVQFFPEGGELIQGVRSRVAFKALNNTGASAAISGYVIDGSGSRVAEFKSEHAGMGSFLITPFDRQSYTAVVQAGKGEKRFTLPQAKEAGYVLAVQSDGQDIMQIRITASEGLGKNETLVLRARTTDEEVEIARLRMDRQFKDLTFMKGELPTGIAALTLSDEGGLPLAERLIFVRNRDQLELRVKTDKQQYKSREKVSLSLEAEDRENTLVTGCFSIAVTDISRLPAAKPEDEHTIFSELLLRSELKGHIEQPNYYFTDTTQQKRDQLNNLLLTQGWRKLIYSKSPPAIQFPAEQSMAISGTLLLRGNPFANGKVSLFSPELGMMLDTTTNSEGRFNFDNLVFSDSARFVIQGRQEKDRSNVTIKLDRIPQQGVTIAYPQENNAIEGEDGQQNNILPEKYLRDSREELAEMLRQGLIQRSRLLEEVVVKATTNPNIVANSSKLIPIPADYVVRADELEGHVSLAHALTGKIPGFYIIDDNQEIPKPREDKKGVLAGLTFHRPPASEKSDPPPLRLFVDGVDWGVDLSQINALDVASVEIYRYNHAIYGARERGGIMVVTTRAFAGIPAYAEKPQGIMQGNFIGYSIAREFYSPDYSKPENKSGDRDLRTTIYWNPDLFIDKGARSTTQFYTADKPGTYRILIEGLDYRGKLGRTVQTIRVE